MEKTLKIINYPTQRIQHNVTRLKTPLEKVLEMVLSQDISENSKSAFKNDIKHFLTWFEQTNSEVFTFKRFVMADLSDFKQSLLTRAYKPASINRFLASLRTFFKTAQELGFRDDNLASKLKSLPLDPLAPKSITKAEIRRFMREVELRKNKRDKFLIGILLYSGLRKSECIALRHSDIKIKERSGVISVHNSKRNKSRLVPVSHRLRIIASEFYEGRSKMDTNTFIFQGYKGQLTSLAVNKIVEKYSKLARIKVTPHILRHQFSYDYLRANPSDINSLAIILGHSSIITTSRYCAPRLEDLAEKVESM